MKVIKVAIIALLTLTWSGNLMAGNLERQNEFPDQYHQTFSIMQNGNQVGYASLGSKDGYVVVGVINTTGSPRQVYVECELDGNGAGSIVYPGSLRNVSGIGLVADKPQSFRVTRGLCGWGAMKITFQ